MELRQNNSQTPEGRAMNLDENPWTAIEQWLATREQRVRESEEIRLRVEKSVEEAAKSVEDLKRSVGLE
jgi:hypothetical protein